MLESQNISGFYQLQHQNRLPVTFCYISHTTFFQQLLHQISLTGVNSAAVPG